MQQFKNRPYKELPEFKKKSDEFALSNVSFGCQWWGIGRIVPNVWAMICGHLKTTSLSAQDKDSEK